MNGILIGILIIVVVVGLFYTVFLVTHNNIAVPTKQYSAPIGPTQTPPYQLNSKYIGADR